MIHIRRRGGRRTVCLASLVAIISAATSVARESPRPTDESRLESWADQGLKVTSGLALWLDADRLNVARQVHGQSQVPDGARVETWYDASGHGWDLKQSREEARPTYLQRALRFDGQMTYLERAGLKGRLKGFTLFVAAAPLSNGGGFPDGHRASSVRGEVARRQRGIGVGARGPSIRPHYGEAEGASADPAGDHPRDRRPRHSERRMDDRRIACVT